MESMIAMWRRVGSTDHERTGLGSDPVFMVNENIIKLC